MSVWVMMKNMAQNGRMPSMKITAGLAQVADAQITELASEEGECDWKEVKVKYTPETDGQYCFGLWCTSVLATFRHLLCKRKQQWRGACMESRNTLCGDL